jgi:hypothetical protein
LHQRPTTINIPPNPKEENIQGEGGTTGLAVTGESEKEGSRVSAKIGVEETR